MQTVESLNLQPVWLNPGHLVATARVILQGHRIRALGVLEGDRLVGVLTNEGLSGLPDDAPIREAMEPPQLLIEASTPVRQVAETFVEQGIERAPVMQGGKFLGIVTASMLLKELRRSWDPLTGLSWSDGLREWGIEALRKGQEIVVLFVDLNDFGEYNKRYGHIVGDKVLQRVAELLREHVDLKTGVLVRYGGDEFAIGIIGTQPVGQVLADSLRKMTGELVLPEAEEPVTFCVGVAGGKRTKERENVHYSSTLDNLINLASQECILQKRSKPTAATPQAEQKEEAKVLSVIAEENSPTALTQVVLSVNNGVGDSVVSGVHARMGRPVLESVAIATSKALHRAFPAVTLEPKMVNLTEGTNGERLVMVTAQMDRNGAGVPVSGVKAVGRDLYVSVAEATVEAFQSANYK
jgi:IMP dehydrogenase